MSSSLMSSAQLNLTGVWSDKVIGKNLPHYRPAATKKTYLTKMITSDQIWLNGEISAAIKKNGRNFVFFMMNAKN